MSPAKPTPRERPAEATAALAGTGGIAAAIATHNWLAVGLACIGYLPAAVTFLVTHGGLRGVVRLVWRGQS